MKILIIPFLLIGLTSLSQDRLTIDRIVAQIGENIILQSDLDAQKAQAASSGVELNDQSDCQILEDLMFQNLLVNQAKLDSLVITDEQVDAEMENRLRVIEQQIGSRAKMEEFYGKTVTQIKLEFRPLIKDRMLAEEMQREITQKITVTPKEIEVFFNKIPTDSIPLINAQLSFQQIVIFPTVNKEDKDLARKKLEDILAGVKAGRNFESEAKKHSEDPGSAPKGGVMNATRGMMVAPFEAAVFSLKEGEVSNIFETEFGYHIVKLLKRNGDDYVCAHILIVPTFSRESLGAASERIEECHSKLKSNEITWENAVSIYSNDDNTKQNKGIIANPITGEQVWSMEDLNQVDQQIYLLTDALDKGEISTPSLYFDFNERKQGVRIVRLMDRTAPHRANLNDDYALIQSAALNQKRQDALKIWTDDKVKNAFIRIDPSLDGCEFDHQWSTK